MPFLNHIKPLPMHRPALFLFALLGISAPGSGQGCSDAGACTAGPIGKDVLRIAATHAKGPTSGMVRDMAK